MLSPPKALLYVLLLTEALASGVLAADSNVGHSPTTLTNSPPPFPVEAVGAYPGYQRFKFGMTPAQINAQHLCTEKLVKTNNVEPEGPESDAFYCDTRVLGQFTFLRFIDGRLAQVHYSRMYGDMENLLKDSGKEHLALAKKYGDWSDGVSHSNDEAGQRTLKFLHGDLDFLQHIFADGAVRIIMKRNERFATLSVHFIDPQAYRTGKSWAGR